MLEKRTLGYLRNPSSQSSMSESSYRATFRAGAKQEEVLILNNDYLIAQPI